MSHDIVRLAEILAAHKRRSPHTVCFWASGEGSLYARLCRGSDVTWRRAGRILRWFSGEWPADVAWPADIPRPGTQPPPGCEAAAGRPRTSPRG